MGKTFSFLKHYEVILIYGLICSTLMYVKSYLFGEVLTWGEFGIHILGCMAIPLVGLIIWIGFLRIMNKIRHGDNSVFDEVQDALASARNNQLQLEQVGYDFLEQLPKEDREVVEEILKRNNLSL